MTLPTQAFRHQLMIAGRPIRLRYYTETIGSVWDDDRTITQSGVDSYSSGILYEIDGFEGTTEKVLVEQGRIAYNDTKFVIAGSLDTTSGVKNFTLSVSGTDVVFKNILPGIHKPEFFGETMYQIIYARKLDMGSLF